MHDDIITKSATFEITGVLDDDNSKSTGVSDNIQSDLKGTGVSFNKRSGTSEIYALMLIFFLI